MPPTPFAPKRKFETGLFVMTPAAAGRCDSARASYFRLLERHCQGDWGDVGGIARRENNAALTSGEELCSAYRTGCGPVWIVTTPDRFLTALILPEEYQAYRQHL